MRGHPSRGEERLSAPRGGRTCLAGTGVREMCELQRRAETLVRLSCAAKPRAKVQARKAQACVLGAPCGSHLRPPCGGGPDPHNLVPQQRMKTFIIDHVDPHHQSHPTKGLPLNACLLDGRPLADPTWAGGWSTAPHCIVCASLRSCETDIDGFGRELSVCVSTYRSTQCI